MTYFIKIVEADGTVIERPYTEQEIADAEARKTQAVLEMQKSLEAKTKREVAEAKLLALGLTANDLKALGL